MRLGLISVIFLCAIGGSRSETVSNILRLSKPQKVPSIGVKSPDFNVSDVFSDKEEGPSTGRSGPLIAFSKNNPELDWKKHLKNVAKIENESPRHVDLDFMKDKLEQTGNSVQWLTDLYDPLRWKRVPGKLDDECRRDMEWFLQALKDGKLWAAKSKFLRKELDYSTS